MNKSILGLSLLALLAGPVFAEDKTQVRIALGTSTINIGYPNMTLPLQLGYWEEEGLDVELYTTGGTLQGIQQVVGGGADFVEGNVSGLLQGIESNGLPLKVLVTHGVVDWQFVVPAGSDIKDGETLAGKKLGMISLATGGIPLVRSYLANSGVDPDSIEIIPVGFGAAPIEALRNGQVDALLYWGSAVAAFENTGLDIEKFAPEAWRKQPDYVLGTNAKFEQQNPGAVVGIARGMMKAVLFAKTNPECARDLFWRDYPETRSNGPDEETSKAWDLNILNAKISSFESATNLSDVEGEVSAKNWEKLQAYLVGTGVLKATIPTDGYLTSIPDFFSKVNDFDREQVLSQAKVCDI